MPVLNNTPERLLNMSPFRVRYPHEAIYDTTACVSLFLLTWGVHDVPLDIPYLDPVHIFQHVIFIWKSGPRLISLASPFLRRLD